MITVYGNNMLADNLKNVGLAVVAGLIVMLLVMGAGCTGEVPVLTGNATATATPTAAATASPTAVATTAATTVPATTATTEPTVEPTEEPTETSTPTSTASTSGGGGDGGGDGGGGGDGYEPPAPPTVFRIASPNVVESTAVLGDYNLDQFAQISLPTLVGTNENSETIGVLAENWESNADSTRWTFTISDSYVWSDGTPVTGRDVQWTFDTYYRNEQLAFMVQDVISVELDGIDDKKVTFVLNGESPSFYTKFVTYSVLPEHIWSTIPNPTEYRSNTYVGCGPYYIENIDLNAYLLTFAVNPYWAGETPYYDKVEIHMYEDENAAVMALGSEADTYWVYSRGFPSGKISALPSNMIAVRAGTPGSFPFLGFNLNETKNSVAKNLTFRQAVSYALNYPQMQMNPDYGGGSIGTYGFVPTSYDPASADYETLTYNPTRAEELLDAANYTVGSDGWRTNPDGSALTVKLLTDTSGEKVRWGQYIETYLEDIGVDVDLRSLAFTSGSGPWLDAKNAFDYDLVVVVVTQKALNDMGDGYATNYFIETFPIGTGTLSTVSDPAFRTLVDELGASEKGSAEWLATGSQVMDYYAANIPGLAINWRETYHVQNTDIEGWVLSAGMGYLNIENLVSIRPAA